MESDVITLQELFEFKVERGQQGRRRRRRALGPTGLRPTFLEKFEKRGVALPVGHLPASPSHLERARAPASDARNAIAARAVAALVAASLSAAAANGAGAQAQSRRGATVPGPVVRRSRCRADRPLTTSERHVTENGRPVRRPDASRASAAARQQSASCSLIDASDSMHGKPIAAAMTAARAFVAARAPGQQLAFVTFNDAVHVVLPLTTDRGTRSQARSPTIPHLATGRTSTTRSSGPALLAAAQAPRAASIVLLSDGADIGSVAKPADGARPPRDAHVRIYTVGLRSPQFDPTTLCSVAAATGGYVRRGASGRRS